MAIPKQDKDLGRASEPSLRRGLELASTLKALPRRESGVALVLTVLVLTIVLVVVAQIITTVRTESLVVANQSQDQSLSLVAPGAIWHLDALFEADLAGELKVGEFELKDADTRAEPFVDPMASTLRTFNSDTGSVSYDVEDLERRFNLNWLLAEDQGFKTHAEGALARLVTSLGHPPEFADKLKEFIQGTTSQGSEEGNPEAGQGTPLGQPVNSDTGTQQEGVVPLRSLLSLDELYDIEFDDLEKILTGKDENGEALTDVKPLFDFVTVRNTPGLNFNTAPGEILAAWLPTKDKATPNANEFKKATRLKAAKELIALRVHTKDEENFELGAQTEDTPAGEEPDPDPQPDPDSEDPDDDTENPNQSDWIGKAPFTKLADIATAASLKNIFSAQAGKGPGGQGQAGAGAGSGSSQGSQGPKNWYDVLTFRSRLFRVTVRANSNDGQQKTIEAIVFRGGDQSASSEGAPASPSAAAAPPTKVLEWRDISE